MNKLIEIDELKLELKKSNCKLYNTLLILDKIKDKLKQDKVSKKGTMSKTYATDKRV